MNQSTHQSRLCGSSVGAGGSQRRIASTSMRVAPSSYGVDLVDNRSASRTLQLEREPGHVSGSTLSTETLAGLHVTLSDAAQALVHGSLGQAWNTISSLASWAEMGSRLVSRAGYLPELPEINEPSSGLQVPISVWKAEKLFREYKNPPSPPPRREVPPLQDNFTEISTIEAGTMDSSELTSACTKQKGIRSLPEGFMPRYLNETRCRQSEKCLAGSSECQTQFNEQTVAFNAGTNLRPDWVTKEVSTRVGCECKTEDDSNFYEYFAQGS